MSDINKGLPVRTENNGDVVAKIADATIPTQQLAVEADGSINVNAAFAPGTKVQLTDGVDDALVSAAGELQTKDDGAIALLTTIDADTSNLDVALSTRASEATLSTVAGDTTSIDGKLVDGNDIGDVTINNAAGAAAVNIQDGGNSITVDGSVTVSATDLDIRDLSAAQDNVAISDGTDTLAVNADGSINITDNGGSLTVDATDLDIRDLSSAQDSVAVLQATADNLNANANIQVGDVDVSNANPVPISDAGGSITVDGSVTVSATDLDIRDLSHAQDSVRVGDGTDFLAVNSDGSINVKLSDRSGTEIDSYDTVAAVASGGTSNHDYTTTGAFRLTSIVAAASSRMKVELQVETGAATNVFNTVLVAFTSEAQRFLTIPLSSPKLVSTGARVRIIRTNQDNQAQDVYSTILGYNE